MQKDSSVEQVGVITVESETKCSLQMSGGEFCGNACRAAAVFMCQQYSSKECEISINDIKVFGFCDKGFASIRIKYKDLVKEVKTRSCSCGSFVSIIQKRMTQIVINENSNLFIKKPTKKDAERIREMLRVEDTAVGIIYVDKECNMIPFVWVKEIGSFLRETSCGSGAISCAISLKNKDENVFFIKQPSGNVLKVAFEGNYILLSGEWLSTKKGEMFLDNMDDMNNLKALVALNSFENKDKILAFLQKKFLPYAEEICILENKENNNKSILIGLNTRLKDVRPIVLAGHIDTVVPNYNLYTTNPLDLTIIDNRAYGLGSIDMKSFPSIILDNCLELKKSNVPIILVFTTDEETDLICIENVVDKFKELKILPKLTIVGEPTKCEICNQANGCLEYEVQVIGKSCHSSLVGGGVNSINIMARIISYIEDIQSNTEGLTSNSGVIEGGDIVNRVPEQCKLKFDVRSADNQAINDFMHKVETKILELQSKYVGSKILLNKTLEIPPLEDRKSKIISEIAAELKLNVSKFSAGCEAGYYQALSGDAIVFGVGDIDLAHKPNEFVCIDEYKKYRRLLMDVINRFIQKS